MVKAITDYNNFIGSNIYEQRINAERELVVPYYEYIKSINKQIKISKRILQLKNNNYSRERHIYEKGVSSISDIEDAEETYLGSELSSEQIFTSLTSAKIQITQINSNITELQLEKEKEKNLIETALYTAIENTKNSIKKWKQEYVLQSPIDGILSYNKYWSVNQNITSGEKAFSIINNKPDKIIGKALVPISDFGKIKIGQKVNVKLNEYPYLEYGILRGKIISISTMADEKSYTATFELNQEIRTSYGKNINISGELTGLAEIITENISMGTRIIRPMKGLIIEHFID